MIDYSLSVCVGMVGFSLVSMIFSILAYSRVVGLEKSTHQIQYMPAPTPEPYSPDSDEEGPFGMNPEDLAKKLVGDFEDEL